MESNGPDHAQYARGLTYLRHVSIISHIYRCKWTHKLRTYKTQ